jgi:hypothetical protein
MRPEQIQELMFQMNLPKLAHVIPNEEAGGDGDDPPPDADSAPAILNERRRAASV